MRKAFINTLVKLAEKDEHIYLLTADMGFGLIESFAEKYPERFINVGVAEQNMVGIATGLALSGKIVFTYSIANFPTLRCVEHIRNNICYHNLNVNIVAGNTGLAYGAQGVTHHATEDIAIMRSLPNMTIIAPGDIVETELAIRDISKGIGPCYLRLGKSESPTIHGIVPDFQIGKAITVIGGMAEATIISTGSMLHISLQVAKKLSQLNVLTRVLSMHTIKPLDIDAVLTNTEDTKLLVTIEEHSIIGGLGSAVAEVLAGAGKHIYFKRIGLPDTFCITAGNQDELLKNCSLTVDNICNVVLNILRGSNEKISLHSISEVS